ncbi:MAG: FUSC family membrane protein [Pigmentiphaga sp.]|uniref:FUSC family protein n=1 Tax=Pigmentiphaga sp. TaxID=1977564 RepID=UPI0029B99C45|nr:FUSC family membrane protein [Pigmentiphaga sp.]MDX3908109.1 FUSC family membrane protein [Pigmentiphaga sp.]
MDYTTKNIKKFIYSQYFYMGIRQALGVLMPALVLLGLFHHAALGLAATFGAMCVSIVDQPGPYRHRRNEMLGCAVLGTIAAGATALCSPYPLALWLVVIAQCFAFSLLTVFGRKGGLMGFGCLLLMTLTMHDQMDGRAAAVHTVATLGGGLWYTAFSLLVNRLLWYRQEQQAIAVCVFASAEYLEAKAKFYDPDVDIEENYRDVIAKQAAVAEQQEAARDVVLRELPRRSNRKRDQYRAMLFNLFIDIVDLHETMVAVHTDYPLLRRVFKESDLLVFFRDLLHKLAQETETVGLAVTQGVPSRSKITVKAEFRAIEYEIELLKQRGFPQAEPEAYAALISTFRRARNAARIVDRLHRHTDPAHTAEPAVLEMDTSLQRFLSRQDFRLGRLTSNLRLGSPYLRHAIRVALAAAVGMAVSSEWLLPHHAIHSYWVVLTILVIMKPGFGLSKQRNLQRLAGTFIGCLLVLALLSFVHNKFVLLAAMFLAVVMANSLVLLYYVGSSAFNTAFVLLSFHFLAPGSLMVIGERAIDTLVGSAIALACSYVLPYWEYRLLKPFLRRAIEANRQYLAASRKLLATSVSNIDMHPDDVEYRLARKNVHVAFGNFANSFYRMMLEPKSKQRSPAQLNSLVIQLHDLAAQVSASAPLVAAMPELPPALAAVLDTVEVLLRDAESGRPMSEEQSDRLTGQVKELDALVSQVQAATAPADPERGLVLQQLVYQARQMAKTALLIQSTVQQLS